MNFEVQKSLRYFDFYQMNYKTLAQVHKDVYNLLIADFEKEVHLAIDINAVVDKHLSKLLKRFHEITKILKAERLDHIFKDLD